MYDIGFLVRDEDECGYCGHLAYDHHISWFPGGDVRLIEECEAWPDECEFNCQGFQLYDEAQDLEGVPYD
jgi:hypothetical protein